jgi:hypothetical protein
LTLKVPGSKSKGKGKQTREPTPESVSATPRTGRKKAGLKKKLGLGPELEAEIASHPPSVAGDATPAYSRPGSPAPTISSVVYELDETIPPLKKAKRVDDASMLKRVKTLEEAQRKVWTNIAKRDIAKVCWITVTFYRLIHHSIRFIAICFQVTKPDRHSWSVQLGPLRSKPASLTRRTRKPRRTFKPRLSVSCVKCRYYGRRMKRRNGMSESASRRKQWTV